MSAGDNDEKDIVFVDSLEEVDDDNFSYEKEQDKSVIDAGSKIERSFTPNIENVRHEAIVLIDNILEESIHSVNEQQDHNYIEKHQIVENSNKTEVNSESENYAITCDDIAGLDVVKSPTIESMSAKSFDDNLSFTDEHITTDSAALTTSIFVSEQKQNSPQDGETTIETTTNTFQTSSLQGKTYII